MDAASRQDLIAQYTAGPATVVAALEGITETELDARPAPDEWTVREIVHHLADSEMTLAIRLRRLLAEEHPQIVGYDEAEYARRLYYDRPIDSSLNVLRSARAASASLLERLTEEQWQCAGTHNERGRYTVEDWLTIAVGHVRDHADQIRRARQ